MAKLFDSASDANSIIAKEEVLLPDYVPSEAIHRANEMETIAAAINPMIHGKACTNLFITGPTGTGKTMCMKLVIDQLRDSSTKVIPVYVNCWEFATKMAVYYKIAEALKLLLPRRGLASDEVFEKILDVMKRENFSILLVLDELDSLIFENEAGFLYNLTRAGVDRGARFGIIGISNKKELSRLLDMRVASSLRFSTFEFQDYKIGQLKEILLERAKFALVPKTYDSRIIEECAKVGEQNNGNARLALEILWKAAQMADQRDAKKIGPEDVQAVIGVIDKRPNRKARNFVSFHEHDLNLSEEERLLLEILKDGEKPSSQVYDAFMAKKKKSKRQVRNYLQLLEAKGLVDSKEVDVGENSFLNTKIYSLKSGGAV